jgi:predicted TPR repeat methyltransferase
VRDGAVASAYRAAHLDAAQRHLEAARTQRPEDLGILRALARCLARQRRYAESEALWRELLHRAPDDIMGLEWLSSVLIELDRRDEALGFLGRLEQLAPQTQGLAFHLALARGETPPSAPLEMTRELFDEYASRFDTQLVGELKYRVPRRVAEMLRSRTAVPKDILDLGCGTGLLGVYFGRSEGAFVGIDLSANMLEKAARHAVYSELRQADLLAYLRDSATAAFDCIVANDVFIYVGDLAEVIPATFPVLRRGGALIFSCESTAPGEADLVLRPSKRYAHSLRSVEALCRNAGFRIGAVENVDLRFEKSVPIPGYIVTAEKP